MASIINLQYPALHNEHSSQHFLLTFDLIRIICLHTNQLIQRRSMLYILMDHINVFKEGGLFGSVKEPKESQSSFVRPVQSCLEQSIVIILVQIFKQSVRNKSAVSEHSESTQIALREQSVSIKIRVNTDGA